MKITWIMNPRIEATLLLAAAAVLAPLLMGLSSRRRHSSHPVFLHYFLLGVSAAYIALMPYVLTFLTSYLSSLKNEHVWTYFVLIMFSVLLIQFLRAKADVAALAVAAITSPVFDDGVDGLKIRPSMASLANVLRFIVFQRAAGSFALGRNAQLVSGHMSFLLQQNDFRAGRQLPAPVPCLIVTGERNQDVEESPMGYRVKDSALEGEGRRLVTLDRVWYDNDQLLTPELKDLCLSFALFKCLRYVGVLRGTTSPRLALAGRLVSSAMGCSARKATMRGSSRAILPFPIPMLLITIIAAVNVITEVLEMVAGVRSNWTKISMIGHYVRCRHNGRVRRLFSWLLRSKSPKQLWKDEIRQSNLLKPNLLLLREQSWVLRLRKQLFLLPRRNCHESTIKVPLKVKEYILASFRRSGGQLSDGTATLQRQCQAYSHDITWACQVGEVTTTTDVLLVWHIATSLFEIKCSSQSRASASATARTDSMIVAQSLSYYCAYLLAEAPDLLPGDSAWTKCRYEAVKKDVEEASKSKGAVTESGDYVYGNLIDSFSAERCHDVLKKGSRLVKQLVEEAERPREGETGSAGGGQDAVWLLLAEFWSDMVLYLAPTDNVKRHIEVLQRGGELVTLLWALLLHAGIPTRPAPHVPEP
ncbi:unnamed protein product [Urochloa decumbens]|uniref:DUF4220 domain-containing protein n=1 Tax=Urochloa decumbens TaxID=240449 RepID=A0ABC9ARK9_9POAL